MTTFDEKVQYFKNKQNEILSLQNEIDDIRSKYQIKLDTEINSKKLLFDKKVEEYKAELKAWCGITDGEKATNALETVIALKRIQSL